MRWVLGEENGEVLMSHQVGVSGRVPHRPGGLSFHPDGRLLVTDRRNNRVLQCTLGVECLPYFDKGGLRSADTSQMQAPEGIAVAKNGDAFVAESKHA